MNENKEAQKAAGKPFLRANLSGTQIVSRPKEGASQLPSKTRTRQRTGLTDAMAKSDRRRAGEIVRAFYWDENVPNGKITVRVTNGWVTLEGELLWNHQHQSALAAVCMDGMRGISDNIRVVSEAGDQQRKDRIVDALSQSSFIDVRTLRVAVYRSNITLTGKADTKTRKEEAGRICREEAGSSGFDNQVRVRGVDGHGSVCFVSL